jgi:D-inositol-3-phosphate glycosyltransferase
VSTIRVAHVVFPRPERVRPVLGFVWDAIRALEHAGSGEIAVEPIIAIPARALRKPQTLYRKLRRRKVWPDDLEDRLAALDPKPTLIEYLPILDRSIESATLAIAARLLARRRRDRPAVIHGSFLDEGGYAAAQAARAIGAASIAVAHGTDVRAARGEIEGASGRRRRSLETLRWATKILAVSNHLASELAFLGARAEVLRFTTWAARFPPAPIDRMHNPKTVLFAGAVGRGKGVDVLLEAFAKIRRKDAVLKLVGAIQGDLDPRREAGRLGIADRVIVEPEVPQDELRAHYAESACLVLPSRAEGYGIVLVEAMLVGRPVIGAAIGGIPEIIGDESVGRLVPPKDPDALASAIDAVLDGVDRGAYSPEKLRARALPLTWDAVGPRLFEVTKRLGSSRA